MRILSRLQPRFATCQSGSISIEALFVFPCLVWALTLSLVFTDAYRALLNLQRAAYVSGDLLSRSGRTVINAAYLDGLGTVAQRVANTREAVTVRNTLVGWDRDNDVFVPIWSHSTHPERISPMSEVVLNAIRADSIPDIDAGETLLLTEAWLQFTPTLNVGIRGRLLEQVLVTRPRFSPGIVYDDPDAPLPPPAWCEFVEDACGQ